MKVKLLRGRPGAGSTFTQPSSAKPPPDRRRVHWLAFIVAASVFVGACNNDDVTATGVVKAVTVSPPAASIEVGESVRLKANVIATGGASDKVTWLSSAPGVATVSSIGEVIGVAEGVAVVTAKSVANPAKFAIASITVAAGTVAKLVVEPDPANVVRGKTLQLSVAATNASGAPVTGRTTLWTSDNPEIATVSAAGVVTGVAFGAANVTAAIEGARGVARVIVGFGTVDRIVIQPSEPVVEQGTTLALMASPLDVAGNVVEDADVFWISSNPAIAQVSEFGVITGVALGTARITVRAQTAEVEVNVTVVPAVAATLQISPRPAQLEAGESAQLTALVKRSGSPLAIPITWKSAVPSVASVSAAGKVTGIIPDPTPVRIIASASPGPSSTVADTLLIKIVPAALATISVNASKTTIEVGETVLLNTVLYDKRGGVLTGYALTWNTDKPAIATVSANGTVLGVAEGTATVTARNGSTNAAVNIQVVRAAIASVALEPPQLALLVGQKADLTMQVKDRRGGIITGRSISWSVANPLVASVANSGQVTAIATGLTTVTANVEGHAAQSQIKVFWSSGPVSQVVISLSTDMLEIGQTAQATAALFDAQGFRLEGRPITWRSDNMGVANVDANGLVTAVGPGGAEIRGIVEEVTGEEYVLVLPPFTQGPRQPEAVPDRGSWEIAPSDEGFNVAQTFTPNEDLWLGYLALPFFCSEGMQLSVTLREGIGGRVIATALVGNATSVESGGGGFKMIKLYDPAISIAGLQLVAGRTYAFELAAVRTNGEGGSCTIARGPGFNSYSGGSGYFSHPREGPGWFPIGTGEDLPFITYIRRLEHYED